MNKKSLILGLAFAAITTGGQAGDGGVGSASAATRPFADLPVGLSGVIAGVLAIPEFVSALGDISRLKKYSYSPLTALQRFHDWPIGLIREAAKVFAIGEVASDKDLAFVAGGLVGTDIIARMCTTRAFNLTEAEAKKYNQNFDKMNKDERKTFHSRRKKLKTFASVKMALNVLTAAALVGASGSPRSLLNQEDKKVVAIGALGSTGVAAILSVLYRSLYSKTVFGVLNKDKNLEAQKKKEERKAAKRQAKLDKQTAKKSA